MRPPAGGRQYIYWHPSYAKRTPIPRERRQTNTPKAYCLKRDNHLPFYFINLWLTSYRHRYCTYLYYSSRTLSRFVCCLAFLSVSAGVLSVSSPFLYSLIVPRGGTAQEAFLTGSLFACFIGKFLCLWMFLTSKPYTLVYDCVLCYLFCLWSLCILIHS